VHDGRWQVGAGRADEPAEHRRHRGQVGLQPLVSGGDLESAESWVPHDDRCGQSEALVRPAIRYPDDALEQYRTLDSHPLGVHARFHGWSIAAPMAQMSAN